MNTHINNMDNGHVSLFIVCHTIPEKIICWILCAKNILIPDPEYFNVLYDELFAHGPSRLLAFVSFENLKKIKEIGDTSYEELIYYLIGEEYPWFNLAPRHVGPFMGEIERIYLEVRKQISIDSEKTKDTKNDQFLECINGIRNRCRILAGDLDARMRLRYEANGIIQIYKVKKLTNEEILSESYSSLIHNAAEKIMTYLEMHNIFKEDELSQK